MVDLVPQLAIDNLQLWGASLMKIDVEGGELAVLEGARATIDRYRPAIYLEAEDQHVGTAKALWHLKVVHGYVCYKHTVPLWSPSNWRGAEAWLPSSNQGEDIKFVSSKNALCVHADNATDLPSTFVDRQPIALAEPRDEL